jgi:hypothetical protein
VPPAYRTEPSENNRAILGYGGGKIVRERLVDHAIVARSDYIPRIQEAQDSVYHVLRQCIEDLYTVHESV